MTTFAGIEWSTEVRQAVTHHAYGACDALGTAMPELRLSSTIIMNALYDALKRVAANKRGEVDVYDVTRIAMETISAVVSGRMNAMGIPKWNTSG